MVGISKVESNVLDRNIVPLLKSALNRKVIIWLFVFTFTFIKDKVFVVLKGGLDMELEVDYG